MNICFLTLTAILAMASLFAITPLSATAIFDPATGKRWSEQRLPEINEFEYLWLLVSCDVLEKNIETCNGGRLPGKKIVLEQFIYHLQKVGTPTALRLIAEFKEDKIFYPNGHYMRTFWGYSCTRDWKPVFQALSDIA